jgi:diamine N-acetyltransferase
MPAKPIIDLDVIVSPHDVATACARLTAIGYSYEGNKGIPGRDSMRWPAGESRHHLYVCADDALALRDHLLLRALLQRDATLAHQYAELKQSLAARFRDQREAYQGGKNAFLEQLMNDHAPRIHVRRAMPADAAALSALGHATYPTYFAHIWSAEGLAAYVDREYSIETIRRQLDDRSLTWWVADDRGALVGYAKVRHDRPIPTTGDAGIELDKCYVAPGRTGQGIGAALLHAVTQQAAYFAPRRLWLGVLTTNVAAQRMYAREGFTDVGTMPLATDLGEIGCVVMAYTRTS